MKSGKLQKATALDNSEIERFQRILESLHEEALRSLHHLDDDVRSANSSHAHDISDPCTTVCRETMFQQTDRQRIMVRMIDAALDRIQHGTFGICVACGNVISAQRLDALPWSQHCLRCQEGFEQEVQMKSPPTPAGARVMLKKAG